MQGMDGHNTSSDEMLQTLLLRTAVMQAQMQAQHEATLAGLAALQEGQQALAREFAVLRDGQNDLRVSVGVAQTQIKALNDKMDYYATEAKVEAVRTEIHKSINAQTWRWLIWMTGVCSGLVTAVYYIARNIH